MTMVYLIAGFTLMILGAEALVRGASRLAAAMGVKPLVVGLTIVAFGTSAPELAVSIMSTAGGQGDIALGNVVGSNIFNVLFILGLSALMTPLTVSRQLVRLDVPIMIAISLLLLALGGDGVIDRLEGLLLLTGFLGYNGFLIIQVRGDRETSSNGRPPGNWIRNGAMIIGGLAILVVGSRWLVAAAVSLAQRLGVGELVIGLTIVAAGTSLPEVATSVVASMRGERDIAVGNVVGSNIFNILVVLGCASLSVPEGIPVSTAALHFDIPAMIAVAVACLPIFFTGGAIARWEGAVFLFYYGAYVLYLILAASRHAALPDFSAAMLQYVIPLTALTIVVIAVRTLNDAPRFPQEEGEGACPKKGALHSDDD